MKHKKQNRSRATTSTKHHQMRSKRFKFFIVLLIVISAIPFGYISAQIIVVPPVQNPETETVANPQLPDRPCLGELHISLVADTSGSINATQAKQVKDSFNKYVTVLTKKDTKFSVVQFATAAQIVKNMTSDMSAVKSAINSLFPGGKGNGSTNWQDGLLKATKTFEGTSDEVPKLLIFATDGVPNITNGNSYLTTSNAATREATKAANEAKKQGIHILVVGIGIKEKDYANVWVEGRPRTLEYTDEIKNVWSISGKKTISAGINADYITTSFDQLADALFKHAQSTCHDDPPECPYGLNSDGKTCKEGPAPCPTGQTRNGNGVCVCPAGMTYKEGQCKGPGEGEGECPAGQVKDSKGACKCPDGQVLSNGKCKCPPGQNMASSGKCECPAGYRLSGGKCEGVGTCPPGQTKDAKGTCTCPTGQNYVSGACTGAGTCPEGQAMVAGQCTAEGSGGTSPDDSGDSAGGSGEGDDGEGQGTTGEGNGQTGGTTPEPTPAPTPSATIPDETETPPATTPTAQGEQSRPPKEKPSIFFDGIEYPKGGVLGDTVLGTVVQSKYGWVSLAGAGLLLLGGIAAGGIMLQKKGKIGMFGRLGKRVKDRKK